MVDSDSIITDYDCDFFKRVREEEAKRMVRQQKSLTIPQRCQISPVQQNALGQTQQKTSCQDGTESMVSTALLNS